MFIGEQDFFIRKILNSNQWQVKKVLDHIESYYHNFSLPKPSGFRVIQAIERNSELYRLQKALCENFLEKIPLPTPAVGFVKDESYLSFLLPHVGKQYFLRLDIQNFFGSITAQMLCDHFQEFFPEKEPTLLKIFVDLCTCGGTLPQGAVTSPAISNVVFRQADQRILKYCQSLDGFYQNGRKQMEDICYTRYADDLLFSSNCLDFSKDSYFAGMISGIVKDFGFRLNRNKVKYGCGQISLSGFVVSDNIHLSRQKLYSLNKLLYFFGKADKHTDEKYEVRKSIFQDPNWLEQINQLGLTGSRGGLKQFKTAQELLNYLCGYRSFLLSILHCKPRFEWDSSSRQLSKKVKKLEKIVDCILESGQGFSKLSS